MKNDGMNVIVSEWLHGLVPSSDGGDASQIDAPTPLAEVHGKPALLASLHAAVRHAAHQRDPSREREACIALARNLVRRGYDFSTAVSAGLRALSLADDPELRWEVASWLRQLGDLAGAADTLKAGLSNAYPPEVHAKCAFGLAVVCAKLGDTATGAKAFEDLGRSQSGADALEMAAIAHAQMGSSNAHVLMLEAARAHLETDDLERAFEATRRAFELAPSDAQACDTLVQDLDAAARSAAADQVLRHHASLLDPAPARIVHLTRVRRCFDRQQFASCTAALLDGNLLCEQDGDDADLVDECLERADLLHLLAVRLERQVEKGTDDRRIRAKARLEQLLQERLGPLTGAVPDLRAALDAQSASPEAFARALLFGCEHNDEDLQARALVAYANHQPPATRAVLLAQASALRHKASLVDEAAHLAKLAYSTDPTEPCVVAQHVSMALRHGAAEFLDRLESAWSVLLPGGVDYEAMSQAFETSGDPYVAFMWTKRWLQLRPWDLRVFELLLTRAAKLEGGPLIDVLATPPLFANAATVNMVARALDGVVLKTRDDALHLCLAALDAFGPSEEALRHAMEGLASRMDCPAIQAAVLERWLATKARSGFPISEQELLELSNAYHRASDPEGETLTILRAARQPVRDLDWLARVTTALDGDTSDTLLARCEVEARVIEAQTNVERRVKAWRQVAAHRWSLCNDQLGAIDAWLRASEIDAVHRYGLLAFDLEQVCGASNASVALQSYATETSNDSQAANVLVVASALEFKGGALDAALATSARALSVDPSNADALFLLERTTAELRDIVTRDADYRLQLDHVRVGLDMALAALHLSCDVETARLVHNLMSLQLAVAPDDREILELRAQRILKAVGPRIDGERGASMAVALAASALELFGAARLALLWLVRALLCSSDVDDYRLVFPFVPTLTAEADLAHALVTSIRERQRNQSSPDEATSLFALGDLLSAALDAEEPDAMLDVVGDQPPSVDRPRPESSKEQVAAVPVASSVGGEEAQQEAPKQDVIAAADKLAAKGELSSAIDVLEAEGQKASTVESVLINTRLRELYTSTGRNTQLCLVLGRLIDQVDDPKKRLALLRENASLLEARGDVEEARNRWTQVLEIQPGDSDAGTYLEREAAARGDFARVAEVLSTMANAATTDSDMRRFGLRHALVLMQQLGRAQDAYDELDRLRARYGGDPDVLAALGEAAGRLNNFVESARWFAQAAGLSDDRSHAATLASRAAAAYLALNKTVDAQHTMAPFADVRSADVLKILAALERRANNLRQLADLLDELASVSEDPVQARAAWLIESATCALASGLPGLALDRSERAARLFPDDAFTTLRHCYFEYRAAGLVDGSRVATMLERLESISDRVPSEDAPLHSFLVSEVIGVLRGSRAALDYLARRRELLGPRPLIVLAMAERLVSLGNPGAALPLFDVALTANDLFGLRTPAQVAFAAARAALHSGGPERAAPYAALVEQDPQARDMAERLRGEIAQQLGAGLDEARERLERVAREASGEHRAVALGQLARHLASHGTVVLAADADRYYAEAVTCASANPNLQAELAMERAAFRGRIPGLPSSTSLMPPATQPMPAPVPSMHPHEYGTRPQSVTVPPSRDLVMQRPSTHPTAQWMPAAGTAYTEQILRASSPARSPSAETPAVAVHPVISVESAYGPMPSATFSSNVTVKDIPARLMGSPAVAEATVVHPTKPDPFSEGERSSAADVPTTMAAEERRLLAELAAGVTAAGDTLALMLSSDPTRTRDLLAVRRRQVIAAPHDLRLLVLLREAATLERNSALTNAINHVIGVLSGHAAPSAPPISGRSVEPEQVLKILFRGVHTDITGALADVWEHAARIFSRDASAYGVTGLERVSPQAPSSVARAFGIAGPALGLARTSIFMRRTKGPLQMAIALLSPPAVVITGEPPDDCPELVYRIACMLAATLPQNTLLFGMPETRVTSLLHALVAAFGPPETAKRQETNTAMLAGDLWQALPGRIQRRMNDVFSRSTTLTYEDMWARALQSTRRAGLYVCGDLGVALRDAMNDPMVREQVDLQAPDVLRQVCAVSASAADLARLATSVDYAEVRWRDDSYERKTTKRTIVPGSSEQ